MTVRWGVSEAQRGIWYAGQLSPDPAAYVTADCIRGPAELDPTRLAGAVAATLAEIPTLHVRLVEEGERLIQVLDGPPAPRVPILDMDDAAAARRWMDDDAARPIDPTAGPLCRQAVLRVGGEGVWWYQAIHHLATDAYTGGQIMRRVAERYGDPDGPGPAPLRDLTTLLELEEDYRTSSRRGADLEYWRAALAGAEGAVGPAGEASMAPVRPRRVDGGLDRLADPARIIAAVALWLHRITHRTDIVLGVPWMGRMGSPAARVATVWVNLLPLRLEVTPELSLGAVVDRAREGLRLAGRHGRLRHEQLAHELGYLGSGRRLLGPLVNIKPFATTMSMGPHRVRIENLSAGPVEDLSITVSDGLLRLEGHPDLYGRAALEGHALRLRGLLEGIDHHDPATPTGAIVVTTPLDRRAELEAARGESVAVPAGTIWSEFAAQAARTPDAIAVEDAEDRIDYRQLRERAELLSARLAGRGVGPGSVVGVHMERRAELLVVLLGILRCGAAYLPLEPDQPAARSALMREDAAPALVLEGAGLEGDPAPQVPVPSPDDIAYVLYTSGSTGRPKGVRVPHRAVVNRLAWMERIQGLAATERVLLKTPLGFDVSVWELFWALRTGATVVVAPPGVHRDPAQLAEWIIARRVTVAHFVPSMLKAFLAEPRAEGCRDLAHIVCSGEALGAAVAQRCRRLLPGAVIDNLYGPTEAAVDVTAWRVGPADTEVVPIGRPVWNTAAYVLDMADQPAPCGAVGQLHLAGAQLAHDYLNRPELTAERFVADPHGPPGARMYRTGDLVRRRPDGALEYLGRTDDQVKVRGVRIELGEVEAAATADPEVAQAAAVVRPDGPGGEPWLVVYVVARRGGELASEQVREGLATRLPATMLPGAVVVVERIPTGPTGKLDRAALPAPPAHGGGRPPEDPWQEAICAHTAEVLGLERVGADDNFFQLGGSSLLAARLVGRLRGAGGADLTIGTIFAHPTPAALARALRSGDDDAGRPLLSLRPGTGAPIVCIHPAGGLGWCYAPLAGLLPAGPPVITLQADGRDHAGMEALADAYLERLERAGHTGPVHLVGWSVGGVIAHTMATRLQERGRPVGVLALLDAYPGEQWRHLEPPGPREAREALLTMAGLDPDGSERDIAAVRARLQGANSALAGLSSAALEAVTESVLRSTALMRAARHATFRGDLLFFTAAAPRPEHWVNREGWAPHVAGRIINHDLECTHPAMVRRPAIEHIARVLGRAVSAVD